jgi:hypothetical protein
MVAQDTVEKTRRINITILATIPESMIRLRTFVSVGKGTPLPFYPTNQIASLCFIFQELNVEANLVSVKF